MGLKVNTDWNPVWDVTVRRFEGGRVVEAAVPFKSLRYSTGTPQVWGFNVRRTHKWKNEISFLSRGHEVRCAAGWLSGK